MSALRRHRATAIQKMGPANGLSNRLKRVAIQTPPSLVGGRVAGFKPAKVIRE
jgi:hypothetical protein